MSIYRTARDKLKKMAKSNAGQMFKHAAGIIVLVIGSIGAVMAVTQAGSLFYFEQAYAGGEDLNTGADKNQQHQEPILLPSFAGAVDWLNSAPLNSAELKGKVVLVDFWTLGCINCKHAVPHVSEWAKKYKDQGLVVIGVHTPEFDYEKSIARIEMSIEKFGITYPVAVDNDYKIWQAFDNQYWPAHYFFDRQGQLRKLSLGEGHYAHQEALIQQLLNENYSEPQS